jgi:hypothetical protein
LLEKCILNREENQRLESTSTWIRMIGKSPRPQEKYCVSLTLLFNYFLITFSRN